MELVNEGVEAGGIPRAEACRVQGNKALREERREKKNERGVEWSGVEWSGKGWREEGQQGVRAVNKRTKIN